MTRELDTLTEAPACSDQHGRQPSDISCAKPPGYFLLLRSRLDADRLAVGDLRQIALDDLLRAVEGDPFSQLFLHRDFNPFAVVDSRLNRRLDRLAVLVEITVVLLGRSS